jgi:hypothetical protein
MTQQIEPIEIFNRENKGVFLRVHTPLLRDDISKAEILDAYGNTLFTSILTAKTIEEVAQQLNLTLKTADNTKELLTEMMEADAKDGLYGKIIASETFENVEWVFQFDDDEPKPFPSTLDDTKKLVIEINNTSTSNICFYDGEGKTFKIFAREKQ